MGVREAYGGFRERYLTHAQIVEQLEAWQSRWPGFIRVWSLAKTPGGRDLLALEVGDLSEPQGPSVIVTANMHAAELAGSSVALSIAEAMLALHVEGGSDPAELPEATYQHLRGVRLVVVPRIAVDGAECVLDDARYVRSVPRDKPRSKGEPYWLPSDLDGNGLVLQMRREDPTGEFVVCPDAEGVMVSRQLEDPPPYYKVYPEGTIANFHGETPDGWTIPEASFDLNRNFPWSWRPEPDQQGAGPFPTSEVEVRAIVELATSRPDFYAWIDLHTFGGCFIRPLGEEADTKMNQADLAVYRQLEVWAEQYTGYPMVSGFEEFTYDPETPIYGDLVEYAYHQRGCFSYVCELHDLFHQLGMKRPKRFVDHYTRMEREQILAFQKWDEAENEGRTFCGWEEVDHPQLGRVEVGGVDPRVGLWNPPYTQLPKVCADQVKMSLRLFALTPRLALGEVCMESLGDDLTRIEVTVSNLGYLPTYGTGKGRERTPSEPVSAVVSVTGCSLVDRSQAKREIGHLEGWGRGRFTAGPPGLHRSGGSTSVQRLVWVVKGSGRVQIQAGSTRTGWVETQFEVP
jgi:hypothetical protein